MEAQTIAFQAQCEDVLAEQKRLKFLSDEVGTGLKYYAYLEPVTRRLNAPGASSVIGDDGFVEILTNLDACITYLVAHVSFFYFELRLCWSRLTCLIYDNRLTRFSIISS